jgi:hypothetical protein
VLVGVHRQSRLEDCGLAALLPATQGLRCPCNGARPWREGEVRLLEVEEGLKRTGHLVGIPAFRSSPASTKIFGVRLSEQ